MYLQGVFSETEIPTFVLNMATAWNIYYWRTRFVFFQLRLKREGTNSNSMGILYFGNLLLSLSMLPRNSKIVSGLSLIRSHYRALSKALTKIFGQPRGKCSNGRKFRIIKLPKTGLLEISTVYLATVKI